MAEMRTADHGKVRLLLTGAGGQVGSALLRSLSGLGEIVAPNRSEMDLQRAESIRDMVRRVRPTWIVNPAAYTLVDQAEREPEVAHAINAQAVQVLAEEAERVGAAVLHFSTDYVFDGTGSEPHREEDATGPLNVYGASKLAGEQALEASGVPYAIFRTSWVYGATGKNFLLTILRLAREREMLSIVSDQHGAPTWSRDLAAMVESVIRRCRERAEGGEAESLRGSSGVYHAVAAGETTWHGFAAKAIRLERERNPAATFAELRAVSTAEFPTPARRPQNSRLDCGKLLRTFGVTMPRWEESLVRVLEERAGAGIGT